MGTIMSICDVNNKKQIEQLLISFSILAFCLHEIMIPGIYYMYQIFETKMKANFS